MQPIVDRVADLYGWSVHLMMAGNIPGDVGVTLKRYALLYYRDRYVFRVFFYSWESGGSTSGIQAGWKQSDKLGWKAAAESFLKYTSKARPGEQHHLPTILH
jgi:hypothetical protein